MTIKLPKGMPRRITRPEDDLAEALCVFMSEFGWTVQEVGELPICAIEVLAEFLKNKYKREARAMRVRR